MGIGIVLVLWAIVGAFLATVGMVVLRAAATFLTQSATKDRRRVILAATLLPFLCLGWGGAVFIFQGIVNETVFQRDAGIGDAWKCPLPNGYALLMIDVPDHGWVYNPKTQMIPGGVGERDDAVSGVRVLQVVGRYIAGGVGSHIFESFGTDKKEIDSYFLLDTVTGRYTGFSSLDDLRRAMVPLGIQPTLEPIGRVYSKYRFTWFDLLAAILFFGPPLLGLVLLGSWIFKLRRTREGLPQPA